MKRIRLMRIIARAALFALLFAQGVLLADACLHLDTGPQAAFNTSPMEGCEMGTANPNICLYQYLDQSDQYTPQPSVPPPATQFAAPLMVAQSRPALNTRAALSPLGSAPSIPIRYCSLLI